MKLYFTKHLNKIVEEECVLKGYFDFDYLDNRLKSRLKQALGLYVGVHVVKKTYMKKPEWSRNEIETKLRTIYLDEIYGRFYEWLKGSSERRAEDLVLLLKLQSNEELVVEVKRYIYDRIPKYSKQYNEEREGRVSRRLISSKPTPAWDLAIEYFNCRCAYCGEQLEIVTQDHVVPITKGGLHTNENVLPACSRCNSSKGTQNMEQWFKQQLFFSDWKIKRIRDWLDGGKF